MEETFRWWYQTGYRKLNDILSGASEEWNIYLIGKNIGNVPLSNLMDVPPNVDISILVDILKKEGLKAVLWKFDGGNDMDIIIKL